MILGENDMAEELTPEMLEEASPDLLTLEDEDGKECTFEVIPLYGGGALPGRP